MPRFKGITPDHPLAEGRAAQTIDDDVAALARLLEASQGIRDIVAAAGLDRGFIDSLRAGFDVGGYQSHGTHRGSGGADGSIRRRGGGDLGLGRWGLVATDGSGEWDRRRFAWEYDPQFDLMPPGAPGYDDNSPVAPPAWPQRPVPSDESQTPGQAPGLPPQDSSVQDPPPERNTVQTPEQSKFDPPSSTQEPGQQVPVRKDVNPDPTTGDTAAGNRWLVATGRTDLANWGQSPMKRPMQVRPAQPGSDTGSPGGGGTGVNLKRGWADEPPLGGGTGSPVALPHAGEDPGWRNPGA